MHFLCKLIFRNGFNFLFSVEPKMEGIQRDAVHTSGGCSEVPEPRGVAVYGDNKMFAQRSLISRESKMNNAIKAMKHVIGILYNFLNITKVSKIIFELSNINLSFYRIKYILFTNYYTFKVALNSIFSLSSYAHVTSLSNCFIRNNCKINKANISIKGKPQLLTTKRSNAYLKEDIHTENHENSDTPTKYQEQKEIQCKLDVSRDNKPPGEKNEETIMFETTSISDNKIEKNTKRHTAVSFLDYLIPCRGWSVQTALVVLLTVFVVLVPPVTEGESSI